MDPSSLCLPRFSWSQTCLYHGASEADLLSAVGAASFQLYRLCSEVEGLIYSSNKPARLLLLLGSGGVAFWILYKRNKGTDSKRIPLPRPSFARKRISWFHWLFFEEKKNLLQSKEEKTPMKKMGSSSPLHSKQPPLPPKSKHNLAPCPNCQKGICRLRKHQTITHSASSNISSYANSPIIKRTGNRFLPPTSTPDSADDENSDSEDFYFQYYYPPPIRRRRSGHALSNSSLVMNRSEGEGMSDHSATSSHIYYPTAKLYSAMKRSPGDGQDHWNSPAPSSLCSNDYCDCIECISGYMKEGRYEREESVDSIISATGSMFELIKGAREVRRLIREASFDSLCSDISLKNSTTPQSPSYPCQSDDEASHLEEEEELPPPCLRLNKNLQKSFYSMTALSSLDFEPSSSGGNSLEWGSPSRGWHDVKESKYKMALAPESDQEWEWDSEFGGQIPSFDEEKQLGDGNVSSFYSGLELDMEAELSSRICSSSSSRRSSVGGCSSYRSIGKRLPPSGRSSVERDTSEPPPSSLEDLKFHLSPVFEVKEPKDSSFSSNLSNSPEYLNNKKNKVPSDSLCFSLSGNPPDNIEIINNNG